MIQITHKWPNDVLVNRHKVAGILLESSARESGALDWLVIGVGVNVEHFPDDTEYPATSLRHEGAEDVSPDTVMEAFARHFLRWTDAWREDGFAPIRTAWLARAQGIGEAVRVRLGTETFGGTFVDLDADGALVVEMADGVTRRVTAGDVFPAGASVA
jgi:BirA family biotin operon repressor/biotin-[acetyl-CoA-carboxylase] ligase